MRVQVAAFPLLLALTGCLLISTDTQVSEQGTTISGTVHGGQQPVAGAHVYLFAANTTGYGQPSISLLNSASTDYSDSTGAYVLTSSSGGFKLPAGYACTPATQVYIYALGGNPGAGANTAAGFLAALGSCPTSGSFDAAVPFVTVNEISTVAAVYAFAAFASDPTHVSSSGSPLALLGIQNAFASAANIASLSTGMALTTTPAGNGQVPRSAINTIANVLASCVNSTSAASKTCTTLLGTARSNGSTGTVPTDTAAAAINIAHHAQNGVSALFALAQAAAPFQPQLPGISDFSLTIAFTGGGIVSSTSVAVDASGNVWVANTSGTKSTLSELRNDGFPLSPASGYTAGCLTSASFGNLVITPANEIWFEDTYIPGCVAKFSSNGSSLSGTGFSGGGLYYPSGIAVDHASNAWVISGYPRTVAEFSSTGIPLSGSSGYSPAGHEPTGIAVDAGGGVWVGTNASTLSKFAQNGSYTTYTDPTSVGLSSLAIDSSGRIWSPLADGHMVSFSIPTLTFSPVYTINNFSLTAIPSITIDGASNVWTGSAGVSRFYTDGVTTSDSFRLASSLGGAGFTGLAVDSSGNLWCANPNAGNVVEFIGIAQPVVTPLTTASLLNQLGTRP